MGGLLRSPAVPPSLSILECGAKGSASCSLACPVPQSATSLGPPCCESSPPQLPISAPPTGLDECFFISLVVGLAYSLIFCQFWLFFVFKLLLSFFWLCEEAQCVYLCLHLGWKHLMWKCISSRSRKFSFIISLRSLSLPFLCSLFLKLLLWMFDSLHCALIVLYFLQNYYFFLGELNFSF